MLVTNDQSMFIERAIDNVQEHALLGGILVVLIIFLFLRDFRSTLIVCTSIPVSVIGTFALLYFGGFTLNTMTFGGLALGIGMIVDAAIVVLENTHRHLHMGKDRMTAAIDGSEEVWSAILTATLTHIAVFIPLLFLSGISSILFGQLSIVVMFSLAMSLFVAVTIVPVLCSRWLRTPDEEAAAHRASSGRLYRASEAFLEGVDERYRRALHCGARAPADDHRRRGGVGRRRGADLSAALDRAAAADRRGRGQRQRRAADRHARRAHRSGHAAARGDGSAVRAGGGHGHHQRRRRWRRLRRRRQQQPRARSISASSPRDERERTSDQIAQELRRQLTGPARRHRPRQPGRRQLPAEPDARRRRRRRAASRSKSAATTSTTRGGLPQEARVVMAGTPGIADVRLGRDEGRPEIAIRVDRPKAAMLGMTPQSVASTIQTNVAGTQAAQFRERGNEYPIIVRLREADREGIADIGDVLVSTPAGQVVPARNLLAVGATPGRCRSTARTWSASRASTPTSRRA